LASVDRPVDRSQPKPASASHSTAQSTEKCARHAQAEAKVAPWFGRRPGRPTKPENFVFE